MRRLLLACAAISVVTVGAVVPAAAAPRAATLRVSLLRGEQLRPVSRAGRSAGDAMKALIAGPTASEASEGYRSAVPRATRLRRLTVENGVAMVDVDRAFVSGQTNETLVAAVSQIVKTLSTFPQIGSVRVLVGGKPIQRTVMGIALDRPITLRFLETPNVPFPEPPSLRLPAPDPAVKAAQQQLISLHYLIAGDADGRLGPTTSEGIVAFQKVELLDRTGALDTATRARLATASVPKPITHGGPGRRAEILLDRQVALLIEDDQVVRAIAVSTGKPSTPTPPGSYRVYAKIPQWWSVPFREWLPYALPFVGGIAFHQYAIVPSYPASHGCVRQPVAVAHWTYSFASVGMPVKVLARS